MSQNTLVIDLRSDTVTKPDQEMRNAMAEAEVGDDGYGEDPTVNKLEETVAELLGKEAAMFVPSGIMANLCAIMTHCDKRGAEMYVGDKNHTLLFEQGGSAQVGGVHTRTVRANADATFDLDELETLLRPKDDLYPKSALICVENTNCALGGVAVPLEFLEKLQSFARQHHLPVHMDGARLMNAAVALGVQPRDVTKYVDTVMMCFSKGLGAPIGSALAGPKDFITKARRVRKVLGGSWRQAGVVAAPALLALKTAQEKVRRDHKNAAAIRKLFREKGLGLFEVTENGISTNMVVVGIADCQLQKGQGGLQGAAVSERLKQVTEEELRHVGGRVEVVAPFPSIIPNKFRLVTHCNVGDEEMALLMRKLTFVLQEYQTLYNGTVDATY